MQRQDEECLPFLGGVFTELSGPTVILLDIARFTICFMTALLFVSDLVLFVSRDISICYKS